MPELNANLASRNENPTNPDKSLNTVGSLLADSKLLLSGAFLDKSGRANMEPYLNFPSSGMPFSSSNLSSLLMDASPLCHQNTLVDQSNQQVHKRQKLQQMAGSASAIETKSQRHLLSLPIGMKQETNALTQVLNKSRMEMDPDYKILKQQMLQQLLLKQDIEQLQDNSSQLKVLVQHPMQNQLLQQILHSTPNSRGAYSPQSELQMKNQLPQQVTPQKFSIQSSDDGICSRRLSQYIHNLQHRPKDNSIVYWRKFVSEFYAPGAKERWCLSSYENVLGILSLGTMDAWCCDICGTKSGKGFEASFEILPRLCKMKFESGAIDEILFLEFPRECKFSSGIMMLEYGKAIQESMYEQFRVVREGKLRVIFRHDLKILSWQFCARRHEEYVPRRLVAPQVNQLIYAAHKYQSSLGNPTSGRVSAAELQENCNMFLQSAHQLTRRMDLPISNDSGFSKKHVRCLQIAEVVNSMKDLMDFSLKRRIGPIESLQTYPRAGTKADVWGSVQAEQQERVEQGSFKDMLTDGIRSMAMHLGPESHRSDPRMTSNRVFSGMGDVGSMLAHYHQKTARGSNTTGSTPESEHSCLMGHFSQRPTSSPFQGQPYNPEPLHNSMICSRLPSSQTSEASKNTPQQMIDKWLQELAATNRAKGVQNTLGKQQDQALYEFNANIISGVPTMARGRGTFTDGPGFGYSTAAASAQANLLANVPGSGGVSGNVSNSLKISGTNPTIKREPDLPDFHTPGAFMGGQFSKK